MNIEDVIWDIKEIKNAVHDDADLDEIWLLHKTNSYRAIIILNQYLENSFINPSWLQRLPVFKFDKVTASDDPLVIHSSIHIGKADIPKVIALPDDIGTYRISGSSSIQPLQPCDFNTLMLKAEMDEDYSRSPLGYYSKIGNSIYCYPYLMEGSGIIIASNPMDVPVLENGVWRTMTFADSYPLDIGSAQQIVLEILTKDLAINERSISDITNDSQSQLKILTSGSHAQNNKRERD